MFASKSESMIIIQGEYYNDSSFDHNIDGFTFGGYYHIKENEQLPINREINWVYKSAHAASFINCYQ